MAEILQLPDVYITERDLKTPVNEKNTVLNVAYAGIFERGYVGLPIPIKNVTDLRTVFGGTKPSTKGSFNMVKTMLNSTNKMLVSRAFQIDGTKNSYANIGLSALNKNSYKVEIDTFADQIDLTKRNAVIDGDMDISGGHAGAGFIGIVIDGGAIYDVDISGTVDGDAIVSAFNSLFDCPVTAELDGNFIKFTSKEVGVNLSIEDPSAGASAITDLFTLGAIREINGTPVHKFVNSLGAEQIITILDVVEDVNTTFLWFQTDSPIVSNAPNNITQVAGNSWTLQTMGMVNYFGTLKIDDSLIPVDMTGIHDIGGTFIKVSQIINITQSGSLLEYSSPTYEQFTDGQIFKQVLGTVTSTYPITESSEGEHLPMTDKGLPLSNMVYEEDVDFVSNGVYYGSSTGLYDINDIEFKNRLSTSMALVGDSIMVIANTAGVWGDDIEVQIYGSDFVNNSPLLTKAIKTRVLESHEVLIIATDGLLVKQMIVSLNDSSIAIDHDGNQYNIEMKTKNNNPLISVFMNTTTTDGSRFNFSFKLTHGADGTISMNDIAEAYKPFTNENVDTPIVVTGTGKNTNVELTTLNQGVYNNLLKKDKKLDTLGLFCAPYSGIFDTAYVQSKLVDWSDRGGFKISGDIDKYRVFSTYVTVTDTEDNGDDIVLPVSVILLDNIIKTIRTHGRSKSAAGTVRGVLGGYNKVLFVPIDKIDANELYVRLLNPVQAIAGGKIYLNADQTMLNTNSPYKDASTRMLANMIENELRYRVETFRFEDNTPADRSLLRDSVNDYLKPYVLRKDIVEFTIDTERDIQDELVTTDITILYKGKMKSIHLIFTSGVKVG